MATADGGAPISDDTSSAISPPRSSMRSATLATTAARSSGVLLRQTPESKAARAVRTAVSTSVSSARGVLPTRWPVAGE